MDQFNEAVNAYVHVDAEGAEQAAKASARRWGQGKPLSPIDGIPVSMKDLTEVAGMPCRTGSLTSADGLCDTDAPPARMLREAGAIFLGKTNTPEFDWKAVTANRVFGATNTPWDTHLTPVGHQAVPPRFPTVPNPHSSHEQAQYSPTLCVIAHGDRLICTL
ncbi:amidase family protein [Halomonas gomseomensis]|uniref:Amidase family protein n=1 Tax=Vreelandella gomseomensis TaxID=370766 RepID=A0ABU1G9W6_9GAMM|nr:amidase family protein [Halomonas gomseomensis]